MWSSWTEKATKGLTDALEKTGEAITNAATKATPKNAAKNDDNKDNEQTSQSETTTTTTTTTSPSESDSEQASTAATATNKNSDTNNDNDNNATDNTAQDKGDGGGVANNNPMRMNMNLPKLQVPTINNESLKEAIKLPDKDKFMKNFQSGWSSVVATTKRSINATVEAVEKEQSRLERTFRKGFYKRDPKLPIDAEALRDAEVVYITDRIITMSHPAMASTVNATITGERKLAAVGHLLQRRHDGRFLVWNLSEVEYDISILNDQVLTFSFPGSPSPPLGLLLKLLMSMENWLKADDRNVAVVHCLTGKGRTSTVLAAFLCWMGQAGFTDIPQTLAYIAKCKKLRPEDLTIPSQRRYASYFKNMLDGVRPSQPPLLLKRIIMSEAPRYAKGPPREIQEEKDGTKQEDSELGLMGCAPYLQIFKGGELLFTTAATLHFHQTEEELPFVQGVDGPVPFNVEQIVQGDILLRCRHLTFSKKRVSMFRAAFHTGYVPPNVLRLTKSQLDGACSDDRFPDDFFVDLIFEKVDAERASEHLDNAESLDSKKPSEKKTKNVEKNPKDRKDSNPVVTASAYDSMLHGDSRFWDVIAKRREEHVAKQSESNDPLWGATVGRRRGDGKKKKQAQSKDGQDEAETKDATSPKERTQFETFSIGGEFDFLPEETPPPPPKKSPGKDTLMEALNALDEDEVGHGGLETEEIVFDTASNSSSSNKPTETKPVFGQTSAPKDGETSADTSTSVATSTASAEPSKETPSSTPKDDNTPAATPSLANDMDLGTDDMDALLATADADLGDLDLGDLDDDDDLADLEDMLKS